MSPCWELGVDPCGREGRTFQAMEPHVQMPGAGATPVPTELKGLLGLELARPRWAEPVAGSGRQQCQPETCVCGGVAAVCLVAGPVPSSLPETPG